MIISDIPNKSRTMLFEAAKDTSALHAVLAEDTACAEDTICWAQATRFTPCGLGYTDIAPRCTQVHLAVDNAMLHQSGSVMAEVVGAQVQRAGRECGRGRTDCPRYFRSGFWALLAAAGVLPRSYLTLAHPT